MILVLAREDDVHADAVVWHLRQLGARTARINPENFLEEEAVIICRPDLGKAVLSWNGCRLEEIEAVFCRNYQFFQCQEEAPIAEHLRASEARSALGGFFRNLDAFWLNDPFNEDFADNKLFQYRQAARHGLRIPKTLVGNDPQAFAAFYAECAGKVIIKQLGEICLIDEEPCTNAQGLPDIRAWGFYTQRVEKGHLDQLEAIAAAPCLFQEEIPKKSELRINIVGDQCFAWRIYSQCHAESSLDFRLRDDLPTEKTEIPEDLKKSLISLIRSWGLVFAAVDMVETPGGEIVFLEANVSGNWLWLERDGSEVARAIAGALLQPGRVGCLRNN